MKIVITGANGFIGYNLYLKLKEKFNCEFVLIDNKFTRNFGASNINEKLIECNLLLNTHNNELMNHIKQADFVFHCAAICGVKNFATDYANATMNLLVDFNLYNLITLSGTNARTVYFSTSEVYGSNKKCNEGDNFQILNTVRGQYACEKLMGEYLFKNLIQKNQKLTIVRPFNIIGFNQDPINGHVFPNFIKNAKENKPLIVYNSGNDYRMYCPIDDAINEIVSVMNIDGVFNIGSNIKNNYLSTLQLAQLIIKKFDSKSKIELMPSNNARILYRKPDLTKILKYYKPKIKIDDYIM